MQTFDTMSCGDSHVDFVFRIFVKVWTFYENTVVSGDELCPAWWVRTIM